MSWCNLGQFLKLSERTAMRKVTETRRRLRAKLHRKQETVKKENRQEPRSEIGQKKSFGSWVLKRGPIAPQVLVKMVTKASLTIGSE